MTRGLPVGLWVVVAGVATCGRGLPVGLWVGSRVVARARTFRRMGDQVSACGRGLRVWCVCVCVCLCVPCVGVSAGGQSGSGGQAGARACARVRGRTWGMGHARVRCDLVCCAAAMPLARVSNFSLARSVVAWRMRVMARHCLATIAGYLWQSSGAFVIVLPTATDTASECILTITNMTAERGFSCRKLDCLSRQCTGFAAMQGCNDDSPDFQLGVHTPLQPLAAVIDGQVVPEPAVAGDGPDLIYGRPRARSCNIA